MTTLERETIFKRLNDLFVKKTDGPRVPKWIHLSSEGYEQYVDALHRYVEDTLKHHFNGREIWADPRLKGDEVELGPIGEW
jgi:hypothetical protein